MKYQVEIDGEEREVDVQLTGSSVSVSLDGKPFEVDVRRVAGGLHLIIEGKAFDVAVGGSPEKLHLAAGETRLTASAISARNRGRRSGSKKGGAGELRAPMPGRILSVLVAVGDEITPGTPLVVMEAMKMENELRSEAGGVVTKVEVTEEQAVESGALLVVVEPKSDD